MGAIVVATLIWAGTGPVCPPDMVLGGSNCEYRDLCPDGTVYRGSPCGTAKSPPSPPPRASPLPTIDCRRELNFHDIRTTKLGRSVLIVGGSVGELLEKYLETAERRRLPIELKDLEVVYFEGVDREKRTISDVRLSIGDVFKGLSVRDKWKSRAAGLIAERIPNAPQIAESIEADLVCGGE